MTGPARSVLSEAFSDRLQGRRLVSAIFTTYQFDPGFFEQEIVPVFMDLPLSHVPVVRLVQLDDALRDNPGGVAVYYDAGGLVCGDAGSARLDMRRIPIRHRTGVFHPKNILALVEEKEPDEDGYHFRTLLVACLSANLTRAGWWDNVEAGHVEEIGEGEKTRLRDDLLLFLNDLHGRPAAGTDQSALESIRKFLRHSTDRRPKRSSAGQLHTHFFNGSGKLIKFLEDAAGNRLLNTYMEIISPFFDETAESRPLEELIERFQPREVRLFLPRGSQGEALCRRDFYETLRDRLRVVWSNLPQDLLSRGSGADAGERFVHAKVYRFFTMKPRTEFLFIGSANLTRAAHDRGGNVESGFLVETSPQGRLDFWMTPENPPKRFAEKVPAEETSGDMSYPLLLRYTWTTGRAEAYWEAAGPSPELQLDVAGFQIGSIGPLEPGKWTLLAESLAETLADHLARTSFVGVTGPGAATVTILVQEEGMSHKPSLLLNLSVTDILKYWALLTIEQRAAFLDAKAPQLAQGLEGSEVITDYLKSVETETLFDRFAGIFHSFQCLEKAVAKAIDDENDAAAVSRLFGRRYDSLGTLLDRIVDPENRFDDVERLVILLCAQQVLTMVGESDDEFSATHRIEFGEIEGRIKELQALQRTSLLASGSPDMADFLAWFEKRFLARAQLVETPS